MGEHKREKARHCLECHIDHQMTAGEMREHAPISKKREWITRTSMHLAPRSVPSPLEILSMLFARFGSRKAKRIQAKGGARRVREARGW